MIELAMQVEAWEPVLSKWIQVPCYRIERDYEQYYKCARPLEHVSLTDKEFWVVAVEEEEEMQDVE